MNYSEFWESPQGILIGLKMEKDLNPSQYAAHMAVICTAAGVDGKNFVSDLTRDDFKGAVKHLRNSQKEWPECAAICEDAIALIRKNWLDHPRRPRHRLPRLSGLPGRE